MNLALFPLALVLILTACFKKQTPEVIDQIKESPVVTLKKIELVPVKPVAMLTKEQREAFYFAASLEREALRLIIKSESYDKGTLFSVISAAFENEAGGRKRIPENAGCSRFRVEKNAEQLLLYKTCQKPETLIATVELSGADKINTVFKSKEWGSVIGTSVSLTNPDVECSLVIQNKKLESMDCKNWTYLVTENNLSATEVKLKTFHFERKSDLQFELKGGFYQDLIENKKIAILVPLQGKIKLIEKEIEVIDDFAPKALPPVTAPLKPTPILIGGPHGQKENSEKSREEKQDSQKTNEESQQESGQDGRKEIQAPGSQEDQPEENRQEIEQTTESDQSNGGVPRNGLPKAKNRGR